MPVLHKCHMRDGRCTLSTWMKTTLEEVGGKTQTQRPQTDSHTPRLTETCTRFTISSRKRKHRINGSSVWLGWEFDSQLGYSGGGGAQEEGHR